MNVCLRFRRVGVALIAMASAAVAAHPAGVARHPLVDRAIAFHGGERYRNSRTTLELCSASGCSRIAVEIEGGIFDYTVTGRLGEAERRVRVTNDEVEHWLDGIEQEIADADERRRLRDWVMARVYFCFLPYRLNDPGVVKHDQGLEQWGDRLLHRVKVTFETGVGSDAQDEYVYWFDPESARVEMFAYSYEGGDPGLRFRRATNYRRVGGLLFFDQENLGTEGEGLSVDLVDPEFVAKRLRRVSTVELRDLHVEAIE